MKRVPELDALRGLAAISVLLYHLRPHDPYLYFGMSGVHLFFVLSGYLITGIVIKHAGTRNFLPAFYARRILRIWPIYYLLLAILLVLNSRSATPVSLQALPYYLTFMQNVYYWPVLDRLLTAPPAFFGCFEHSWTLALEEQFYLFWPLAITLAGRKRVIPLALGILAFGFWFKTLGYHGWILLNCFGAFALGGLLAAILSDPARVQRNRWLLTVAFAATTAAMFLYLRWYFTVPVAWSHSWLMVRDSAQNFAFYGFHFGIIGLVATNAGRPILFPLRSPELVYLGEISYGLYWYHLPIYWAIAGPSIDNPWPIAVSKLAITFTAAALSYRWIEKPILALKDRVPYSKEPVRVVNRPRLIFGRTSVEERIAP